MKRSIKIGMSLIVIGAVLALIGFSFGGSSSSVTWNGGFKVIDYKTKKEKMKQQMYAYDDVKNIQLSTALPVRIITGDVNRVTVKVKTYYQLPDVSNQENSLKITDKQKSSSSRGHIEFNVTGFSWNYGQDEYQEGLVITVPQSQNLTNVQLTGKNSNDVNIENIQSDRISIQQVADTNLKNITVKQNLLLDEINDGQLSGVTTGIATIKSDYGDLTVQNTRINNRLNIRLADGDLNMHRSQINDGEIRTTDGDINLMNNQLSNQLSVTTQEGDIVTSIGKSSVRAKTLDGDISTFNNHDDDRTSYTYKGMTGAYILSTNSGDVTIRK
ncbi:hypothetical protein GCM10025879_10910 [Leuconostoc litchii]|uniref:DUF4097 domain-containing protein n=1 Tax=Leuconostoc litchii TaxID=1981069 RepID=A0A6P2CJR1_9LACO|nr:DUF4097 family beta strand repeat-containing protein [Leuconostoc litchii]TYC46075.1 hypothetical protein ESZ47_08565 [Leuconostoc litchii]GMA69845.1 hypothetical protein GCM10025879_10910 [Leuconostoc litchii]